MLLKNRNKPNFKVSTPINKRMFIVVEPIYLLLYYQDLKETYNYLIFDQLAFLNILL